MGGSHQASYSLLCGWHWIYSSEVLLWPSDTGVGNWVHFGKKMAQPRLLPPTSFNIMLEFQVLLIGSGWWLNPQVIISDIDYHLKWSSIKTMGRVIIVTLAELLQGFYRVLGRDSAKLFRWNFPCTACVKISGIVGKITLWLPSTIFGQLRKRHLKCFSWYYLAIKLLRSVVQSFNRVVGSTMYIDQKSIWCWRLWYRASQSDA